MPMWGKVKDLHKIATKHEYSVVNVPIVCSRILSL